MEFDLTNITMPMAALLASLIGATATITAALLQLRMAWRKEMKARERGQPITQQARRGPVVALLALLIASAVGGFALSQYLDGERTSAADQLRNEFNARLDQLGASARRLEQIGLANRNQFGPTRASSTVILPPCQNCTEAAPVNVAICTSVPIDAYVGAIELYSRDAELSGGWSAYQVQVEQIVDTGRYTDLPREWLESDTMKQVCQTYLHWDTLRARALHIVVHHSPNS